MIGTQERPKYAATDIVIHDVYRCAHIFAYHIQLIDMPGSRLSMQIGTYQAISDIYRSVSSIT